MRSFLLALALLMTTLLSAQNVELGVSFGNTSYVGDLVCVHTHSHFDHFDPAIGVFARYNYQRFSTRLGLTTMSVQGNDANSHYPERGLSFRSRITELSLTGEFNIMYLGLSKNSYIAPYAFAGLSIFRFNPETYYKGDWVELQPLGTEGQGMDGYNPHYSLTQIAIPFGMGIKYKVNEKLGLSFDVNVRKLFTDYLDDVSGVELNYQELYDGSGEMAAYLSQPSYNPVNGASMDHDFSRGANGKDMFYTCNISVTYSFGADPYIDSKYCPKFK